MRAWILLIALVIAGCSGPAGDAGDGLQLSDGKGGIRGVVVDGTITPVAGATVVVQDTALSATTGEDGTFSFTDLEPGPYFIEAAKPLYGKAQHQVEVVADVPHPDLVKLRIDRLTTAEPYLFTDKFEGYITCSANLVVFLSEECGEGLGVPCEVPEIGCQRVGGQQNNRAQIDFFVDGPDIQTLIVEQVWTPSSSVGAPGAQSGGFYTVVATEWSCLPVCGGNEMAEAEGESPLYVRVDNATLEKAGITADTVISSFTWARSDETGLLLNQKFELFVTASYVLPAPEGWSYVAGDPDPFA